MIRDQGIVIRVEQETKWTLERAAEATGKTLSTFVIEAAEAAAKRVRKKSPPTKHFRGVPSFFRAACAEAGRGGSTGYAGPGWTLAIHLSDAGMIPDDMEVGQWERELEHLRGRLKADDAENAWEWFEVWFPRCVSLIPLRRKAQFLQGVQRAYEEERI